MNTGAAVGAEREHVANLLESLQRAHYLHVSAVKVAKPDEDFYPRQAHRQQCAVGPGFLVVEGSFFDLHSQRDAWAAVSNEY